MVSSLSPDFCRTVGQCFLWVSNLFINSTSTFLMRDLPGEQMELRFLDLIVTVTRSILTNWTNVFPEIPWKFSKSSFFISVWTFLFFRAEKPTVSVSLDLRSKKIRRDCSTWQTWKNLISDFPERLKIRQRCFFVWVKCWWIWRGSSSPEADPLCTCCSVSNGVIKIALILHSVDESGRACDVQPLYSKKHQVPGNSLWLFLGCLSAPLKGHVTSNWEIKRSFWITGYLSTAGHYFFFSRNMRAQRFCSRWDETRWSVRNFEPCQGLFGVIVLHTTKATMATWAPKVETNIFQRKRWKLKPIAGLKMGTLSDSTISGVFDGLSSLGWHPFAMVIFRDST